MSYENDDRLWLFYTPWGRLIIVIVLVVVVVSVALKWLGYIN